MSSIKIKKDTSLRKAILQAAITGQLISNVEGETETGKQLLDRIIEERKNKLSHGLDFTNAKSGKRKSKKETALAGSNPCDIPEDKIPFEIPENWCWCRLGDLGITNTGTTPSKNNPEYFGKHIDFLSPGDIQDSKITYGNQGLSESGYKVARPTPPGTIIQVCIGGSIGKCAIVDREVTFNQQINSITVIKCSTQYVYSVLSSDYFHCIIRENSTGTATPIINKSSWEKLLIPLPPLAVQNAIVEKLEEVLPLVDAYENVVLQKEELKNALSDSLKKAILQEAIQGKLTESWRKDVSRSLNMTGYPEGKINMTACHSEARSAEESLETGKQLLDRIIEERNAKLLAEWEEAKKKNPKAKKPTLIVTSEIDEEDIPFEVPDSWCWCRLGDVGDWKAGSTPSRSNPKFYNGNIPWLKTGDLTDDFVDVIPECISEIALESCSIRLNPVGSVLIAMYGATIGKLGILNIEATTNQACCACITHEPISNKYLFYYLMSQKKALTEKAEGGAQPNISREKLVIHPFPLPPLAEQKKIVEILEQMLPLCEKLGG